MSQRTQECFVGQNPDGTPTGMMNLMEWVRLTPEGPDLKTSEDDNGEYYVIDPDNGERVYLVWG